MKEDAVVYDKGEDTLERRCEGHDKSQVQNTLELMWWLDMSGQVYSQWSGYDEYEDQGARRYFSWTISGWLIEH